MTWLAFSRHAKTHYINVQSKDIFQIISLIEVYRHKALVYNKAHKVEHKHHWIINVHSKTLQLSGKWNTMLFDFGQKVWLVDLM